MKIPNPFLVYPFYHEKEASGAYNIPIEGLKVYNVQSLESRFRNPNPFKRGYLPEWTNVTLANEDMHVDINFHMGVPVNGSAYFSYGTGGPRCKIENFKEVSELALTFLIGEKKKCITHQEWCKDCISMVQVENVVENVMMCAVYECQCRGWSGLCEIQGHRVRPPTGCKGCEYLSADYEHSNTNSRIPYCNKHKESFIPGETSKCYQKE